jgi:hypothetical protein
MDRVTKNKPVDQDILKTDWGAIVFDRKNLWLLLSSQQTQMR